MVQPFIALILVVVGIVMDNVWLAQICVESFREKRLSLTYYIVEDLLRSHCSTLLNTGFIQNLF